MALDDNNDSMLRNLTSSVNADVGNAFAIATGILLVVTNGVGIYFMYTSKTIAEQIRTMIFHLSLSDALLGVFATISCIINRIYHFVPSNWTPVIGKFVVLISLVFTAALSLDRMLSVSYPNWYLLHVTQEKTLLVCRIIWLSFAGIVVLLIFLLVYEVNYLQQTCDLVSIIIYIVTTATVANSSCRIYKHGYQQFRRLHVFGNKKPKHFLLNNYKATITLLSLCLSMIILYLPLVAFNLIRIINLEMYQQTMNIRILQVSRNIALLNHFINPFQYIFRFKECRERIFYFMFPCCCPSQENKKRNDIFNI